LQISKVLICMYDITVRTISSPEILGSLRDLGEQMNLMDESRVSSAAWLAAIVAVVFTLRYFQIASRTFDVNIRQHQCDTLPTTVLLM